MKTKHKFNTFTTHVAYKTEIVGDDVLYKYILYAENQYVEKAACVCKGYDFFMSHIVDQALKYFEITLDDVKTYVPIEMHIDF